MFESLFYITGALSVALLILLLGRHEKLGEAVSQVDALKREGADLRQQLKKEAEDFNHLLNHLRAYYDDREERKKEIVPKGDGGRDLGIHVYTFDEAIKVWAKSRPAWADSPIYKQWRRGAKNSFRVDPPKPPE